MFLLPVYKKGMKTKSFKYPFEKKKISAVSHRKTDLLCFLSCLQPEPALVLADVGCAAWGTLQNLLPGQGLQRLCRLRFGGWTGPVH